MPNERSGTLTNPWIGYPPFQAVLVRMMTAVPFLSFLQCHWAESVLNENTYKEVTAYLPQVLEE